MTQSGLKSHELQVLEFCLSCLPSEVSDGLKQQLRMPYRMRRFLNQRICCFLFDDPSAVSQLKSEEFRNCVLRVSVQKDGVIAHAQIVIENGLIASVQTKKKPKFFSQGDLHFRSMEHYSPALEYAKVFDRYEHGAIVKDWNADYEEQLLDDTPVTFWQNWSEYSINNLWAALAFMIFLKSVSDNLGSEVLPPISFWTALIGTSILAALIKLLSLGISVVRPRDRNDSTVKTDVTYSAILTTARRVYLRAIILILAALVIGLLPIRIDGYSLSQDIRPVFTSLGSYGLFFALLVAYWIAEAQEI